MANKLLRLLAIEFEKGSDSMKKSGILNKDIGQLLYELGHTDAITIADAGLPIPEGIGRIDLSLKPGMPSFLQVLDVLLADMYVESITLAEEIKDHNPDLLAAIETRLPDVPIQFISHATFKECVAETKGVLRSGECTPYANIILHSGNIF